MSYKGFGVNFFHANNCYYIRIKNNIFTIKDYDANHMLLISLKD